MFRPRIIPCLLLKDLGLVKTIKFQNPNYIGDPMNSIKIFNDLEVDEIVFLDIDATKRKRCISFDFVKKVSEEAFVPFAVGGGITSFPQIKEAFSSGAEKVIINTSAINNPCLIKEASEVFGSQSIIISIDSKKTEKGYEVFTHSGTFPTGKTPEEIAKKMQEFGAGEIMINSIDNDGLMNGYDQDLIKIVSESVSIPVIAIGGAGRYEDLVKPIQSGASASAAGSIFVYNGKNHGILINYPDKEEIKEIFGKFK
jgi:imidazole glycerol-phosphate synthase subunit HisF